MWETVSDLCSARKGRECYPPWFSAAGPSVGGTDGRPRSRKPVADGLCESRSVINHRFCQRGPRHVVGTGPNSRR